MRKAALIAVFFVAACRTGTTPHQNPYANRADAVLAGARLYRNHCAQCHGADANGHVGPSLRSESVNIRSDGQLFSFITNGDLRRGMPSWSQLPAERRWQLVTYLRTLHSQ